MEGLNNYKFDKDKWYIVDNSIYGKLEKGRVLGTQKNVVFYDKESEWLDKLTEFNIDFKEDLK